MLYYKTKLECMFESHILIMEWRRGKRKIIFNETKNGFVIF